MGVNLINTNNYGVKELNKPKTERIGEICFYTPGRRGCEWTQVCDHKIVLDNIEDQETFTYSLVLCKGHVEDINIPSCSSRLQLNSNALTSLEIDSKTKHFKCLLELQNESHTYVFAYCSASFTVTIRYRPRTTSLTILPLYLICEGHNGRFPAPDSQANSTESACKRIATGAKLIQTILGDKLKDFGLKNKSFSLEPRCEVFYSKLSVSSALEMSQTDLWYYFAREIMSSSLSSCDKKYLAFLPCSKYDGSKYVRGMKHKDLIGLTKGYVAYGGDGLALLSASCLYTWPENTTEVYARFKDNTPVDTTKFMDDSCYRGTWGGCFATTLGAALHELCHTFNLGHSETGIMGCDFGNTQNVFLPNSKYRFSRFHYWNNLFKGNSDYMDLSNASLAILNYHKWFNGDSGTSTSIHYNSSTRLIKSTVGIRVVELRRDTDGMVLKFWDFLGKVRKFSFRIPETVAGDEIILFVQDNDGNIITESMSKVR